MIKKVKNTEPWTYVINDLTEEEIAGTFYENKLPKRQIKNNSFNSWINKRDIV